jgi:hypothetical protein
MHIHTFALNLTLHLLYIALHCRVRFTNAVQVTGVPELVMQIGEQVDYRTRAKYVTGSGTTDIVFEYIVQPGDDSIRLGYDGEASVDYPSTTTDSIYSIYDATVLADVTLPKVWSYNQLGEESAIQV